MLLGRSLGAWIRHFFVCMGGCLGCCTKATPVIAVDEPTKGLKIQGRTVKKPSVSEDYFWSTSTCEMENSALQSQRSLSSISVPNQTFEAHNGASTSSPDFVNHGYLIWKQTRQQWVANKKTRNKAQQSREPRLSQYCVCNVKSLWLCSWNVTYDSLLGNNKPFHQPIPLSEMVDFLVDVWEQEGMYD